MSAIPFTPRAALAAALLLAAPVTGLAQAKPRATTPARTLAPAAPAPAAAKPAPAPKAVAPPFDERGPWRLGASLGWEWDTTPDSDLAGPRLQVELERDLVKLGGRGQLSFVAAAAWWRGAVDDKLSFGGITVESETVVNLVEVIPAFRAGIALHPRLRLFAELGAGAAFTTDETEVRSSLTPGVVVTESDDRWHGVLRLSGGATWSLNDRFRVGVQLPTFHWRFGEEKSRSVAISALAAYAF